MSAILLIKFNIIRVFSAGRDASALITVTLMAMGGCESSDRRLQKGCLPVKDLGQHF